MTAPAPLTAEERAGDVLLDAARLTLFGRMRLEPVDDLGWSLYLMARPRMLKIGITEGPPAARARQISTACGERVEVLAAYFAGNNRRESLAFERAVHAKFGRHRLLGEWFRDMPAIRSWFGVR